MSKGNAKFVIWMWSETCDLPSGKNEAQRQTQGIASPRPHSWLFHSQKRTSLAALDEGTVRTVRRRSGVWLDLDH